MGKYIRVVDMSEFSGNSILHPRCYYLFIANLDTPVDRLVGGRAGRQRGLQTGEYVGRELDNESVLLGRSSRSR